MPTTRKDDLVTKLPSNFTSNETKNRFAEIFSGTSCSPTGVNLFRTGNRPSGSVKLCETCCFASGRTTRNLTSCRNLTLVRKFTLSRMCTLKIFESSVAKQRNRSRLFGGRGGFQEGPSRIDSVAAEVDDLIQVPLEITRRVYASYDELL